MLCILKSTSECLSSSPYNQGLNLGLTFSITSQFGYYIFKLPAIRNFYLPPNFYRNKANSLLLSTLDVIKRALTWTLCQYIKNRARHRFTFGDLSCRAAASVDSITDRNGFCCVLSCRHTVSLQSFFHSLLLFQCKGNLCAHHAGICWVC